MRSSGASSARSGSKGVQVTDVWVGDGLDPPLATGRDVFKALALSVATGLIVVVLAASVL